MTERPRYSIIPGGAVTDQRLEPRDLHVLCFLGIHTDKLGWCFLTQGGIAKALNCSRASVQRSLARLAECEWVEVRSSANETVRAHACHAYRVRMDQDDPEIVPSESEVEAQIHEGGCPPVNTPAQPGRAGVPTQDGHGGAHACMGTEDSKKDSDDDDSRSREASISEAFALTKEIAVVAGITDDDAWPPGWQTAAHRVEAFLREGYTADDLRNGARQAMANKRDGPPHTIEYFNKPWAKARGQREAPVPSAEVPSNNHRRAAPRPGSREDRQEQTANARKQFRERAYGLDTDGRDRGDEAGGSISGRLCLPKPD